MELVFFCVLNIVLFLFLGLEKNIIRKSRVIWLNGFLIVFFFVKFCDFMK